MFTAAPDILYVMGHQIYPTSQRWTRQASGDVRKNVSVLNIDLNSQPILPQSGRHGNCLELIVQLPKDRSVDRITHAPLVNSITPFVSSRFMVQPTRAARDPFKRREGRDYLLRSC